MDVATIRTDRLDLISISLEMTEALLEGRRSEAAGLAGLTIPDRWPDEREAHRLGLRGQLMREKAEPQEWLTRAVGLRLTDEMVGYSAFHGQPVDGIVEIGYTVFEPCRRKGYAEEATRGLMQWARDTKATYRFRLSIAPDNEPSLGLASKLGFTRVGEQIDELDGLEYVFELSLS